jgi:hypothetical protein
MKHHTSKFAGKIDDTDCIQYGKRGFFTAYDAETAAIFGERTVNNVGGSLDSVVLVMPKDRVTRMMNMKQMSISGIDDLKGRTEIIFNKTAQEEIIKYGELIPLGSDFFKP